MDEDAFWVLIEQSGRESDTKKARLQWLEERLSGLSVDDIIDFQKWFNICEYRSNTWDLWVAYHGVFPLGSEDGFLYFRSWLISLGHETFEHVVTDPDTLIEVPEVLHLQKLTRRRKSGLWTNEEYPEFQLLAAVAWGPYKKCTGLELETLHDCAHARTGLDEGWYKLRDEQPNPISEEEFARRFPRIMRYWGGMPG
ncbi:DUF4240 domain-containing protein [Nonomuraea sp. NPDC049714]|uniref:DUF4240 domain-containing protein n=1 Tax=Nonomuraea sp. NPDC049714 TaxID=3364357 RepID=UPI0037A4DBF5